MKFETYLRNPRLFNLQIQCLLYDGPCDIVGRFLKRELHQRNYACVVGFSLYFAIIITARVGKALLGECYLCTPNQEKEIQKLLVYVQEKRPDLYRLAISKYLQKEGIEVPREELDRNKQVEDKQGL